MILLALFVQREIDNEKKAKHELAERCEQLQLQVRRQDIVSLCSYVLMYLPPLLSLIVQVGILRVSLVPTWIVFQVTLA